MAGFALSMTGYARTVAEWRLALGFTCSDYCFMMVGEPEDDLGKKRRLLLTKMHVGIGRQVSIPAVVTNKICGFH